VACGVGFDVIDSGAPRADVVGSIGSSFLGLAREQARRGPTRFRRRRPVALRRSPVRRRSIDRSLQHITPIEALREIVRVTAAESSPSLGNIFHNGKLETGAKMAGQWEKSFANPYIGREIGVLLQKVRSKTSTAGRMLIVRSPTRRRSSSTSRA
jgi:hypothetical protein